MINYNIKYIKKKKFKLQFIFCLFVQYSQKELKNWSLKKKKSSSLNIRGTPFIVYGACIPAKPMNFIFLFGITLCMWTKEN